MRLDDRQIEVVDDVLAGILKTKLPLQRLGIANDMWKSARELVASSLKNRHPDWDDAGILAEVSRRFAKKGS